MRNLSKLLSVRRGTLRTLQEDHIREFPAYIERVEEAFINGASKATIENPPDGYFYFWRHCHTLSQFIIDISRVGDKATIYFKDLTESDILDASPTEWEHMTIVEKGRLYKEDIEVYTSIKMKALHNYV